ncbi:putative T7SS-secreted protein [Arthrobacter sp. NEB 688]|uniref:endonuclease toxin domain-containing protein n=1 Tax=Arthrobacter sp. NEB 688 TaxID=904039 RepID=UPI0015653316|nr:hypothetical protein [Arthrobacter sp. NEB 688]QKE82876.1 hypothetical protein HL663_02195 [Arthrobacter sp. NEB 688]
MSAWGDLSAGLAPRDLVRGDESGLLLASLELESWSSVIQDVIDGYSSSAPLWEGRAREQWTRRTTAEGRRWRVAESAFRTAADALDAYRGALLGARETAHEARRLWDRGVAAAQAQERSLAQQRSAARATGKRVFVEPVLSAGDADKERAARLLEQARAGLQEAGLQAARTLRSLAELAPERKSLTQSLAELSSPAIFAATWWARMSEQDRHAAGTDFAGLMNHDPQVMREFGAGMAAGAGDALISMNHNAGPEMSEAWKSQTNEWAWQHQMAPGGLAMSGGILVGGELVNSISGPEGRAATATERAAQRLLRRLERYERRYGITDPVQIWDKVGPLRRGIMVEAHHGGNLPGGFKTIDIWDERSGSATSVKSMDLRAPTYSSDASVRSTLKGYVDSMADFEGARRGEVRITRFDVTSRNLLVVIPPQASTPAHHAIVESMQEYARSVGVTMTLKEWP